MKNASAQVAATSQSASIKYSKLSRWPTSGILELLKISPPLSPREDARAKNPNAAKIIANVIALVRSARMNANA
jgi:hypothetical protein